MAREPFAAHFAGWPRPWNYAAPDETAQRLAHAGFTEIDAWLEERPTPMQEGRRFLETVILVRHLDPLPSELRDPFVDEVIGRLSQPLVFDYVRLNMRARRA